MERRDPIAVWCIDRRASLDQQQCDLRGLWTVRSPQVCDAMKRCLAESIRSGDVRSTVEEIANDVRIERLGSVQE
jgi:hypothetical protein